MGPAIETIAGARGPFDLVFIDADKSGYRAYFEAVLPKLAPRGSHRRRQHPLERPRSSTRPTPPRTLSLSAGSTTPLATDPRVVASRRPSGTG